jgi:hypothetical protein
MNQIKQPQWSELKVKVSDLKPYEKNPRTISDQQFEKLKQSIIQTVYHQRAGRLLQANLLCLKKPARRLTPWKNQEVRIGWICHNSRGQ